MFIEIPEIYIETIAQNFIEEKENPGNKKYLNAQTRKQYDIIKKMALEAVCKQVSAIVGYEVELNDTYEWSYETGERMYIGREEAIYNQVKFTKDEQEAKELFKKDGRNYILRKRMEGGTSIRQYWNESTNSWIDD